jgi:DNA repair exonuclease SbcCD ATPase subunit
MLTTRHVTPDGFGLKNTDWNKKDLFVEWRKSWADVNNCMFKHKGLDERIDHRSYKDQGIDREPMLHLGFEASKLEKKGIKTRRGDINRERQKRNEERAAKKAEREQELAESAENTEKAAPTPNEEHTAEKTAQHLNKLREYYTAREKELTELIEARNEIRQEIPRLTYRAEQIDEHAKNIETLQGKVAKLQEIRQNLKLFQWTRKKEIAEAIKHAEQDALRAEIFFKNRFGINPDQAPEEITRIQKKAREKSLDLRTKNAAILNIIDTQDKVYWATTPKNSSPKPAPTKKKSPDS